MVPKPAHSFRLATQIRRTSDRASNELHPLALRGEARPLESIGHIIWGQAQVVEILHADSHYFDRSELATATSLMHPFPPQFT